MEYITDRKKLRTHGIYKCPNNENISISTLKQIATKIDDYELIKKSNRSMWPKQKARGIKSVENNFTVYTDHIKINCDYDEIEEIYETNKELLHSYVDIPPLESFYASMINLYPTEAYDNISLDEMKISEDTLPETNMYDLFADRNEEYIPLFFEKHTYTIDEALERVKYIFENEFVYAYED